MKKLGIVLLLPVLLAACSPQTLRVTDVQLGRTLNSDNSVGITATTFKPNETVYLSVRTSGAGSATIGVRWKYGDRVLEEPKKQVTYRGAASTDFSLNGATGFPPGEYSVDVFFDGKPFVTKTFRVVQ